MGNYRKAPTFLYHDEHKPKLFSTQDAVDKAWEGGWFGPPWLKVKRNLIEFLSEKEFSTKREFVDAVYADPRYEGITGINDRISLADIRSKLAEWEHEWNKDGE